MFCAQQAEKRIDLTLKTLQAAKDAGVKHIVFLSVFYAERDDMTFGKHYKPLEEQLLEIDVPYTIVSDDFI